MSSRRRIHKTNALGGVICRRGSTWAPAGWITSGDWDRVDCRGCLKRHAGYRGLDMGILRRVLKGWNALDLEMERMRERARADVDRETGEQRRRLGLDEMGERLRQDVERGLPDGRRPPLLGEGALVESTHLGPIAAGGRTACGLMPAPWRRMTTDPRAATCRACHEANARGREWRSEPRQQPREVHAPAAWVAAAGRGADTQVPSGRESATPPPKTRIGRRVRVAR